MGGSMLRPGRYLGLRLDQSEMRWGQLSLCVISWSFPLNGGTARGMCNKGSLYTAARFLHAALQHRLHGPVRYDFSKRVRFCPSGTNFHTVKPRRGEKGELETNTTN